MSIGKDLFCLGIALLGFAAVWTTMSTILVLFFGFEEKFSYSVAAMVILLPSFIVGAKVYLWMVRRSGG